VLGRLVYHAGIKNGFSPSNRQPDLKLEIKTGSPASKWGAFKGRYLALGLPWGSALADCAP
jgi:hypothetical protein